VDFRDDTRITALGDGRFSAVLDDRWWIVVGPNGGLLAALLLRAAVATVGAVRADVTPRIQTTQYLATAVEGPIELHGVVERAGRRIVLAAVDLRQGDRLLCRSRVTFGAVQDPVLAVVDQAPPPVGAPADTPLDDRPVGANDLKIRARLQRRFAITEPGCWGGWLRMEPPVPYDHVVVASLMDNWPPSLRTHVTDPGRAERLHTTTIELTTYFRTATLGLDADDECLIVLRSGTSAEGYHQEDAELWSPDRRLLATSRQLALVFDHEH